MIAVNTEIMTCWPILSKAFWHFCDLYKIDFQSIKTLFSLSDEQLINYHKQSVLPQLENYMEIVQYFLRIHAHLHIIFGQQNQVIYNWLHVKRPEFDDLSALEYILKNPEQVLEKLIHIENYLKSIVTS